MVKPVQGQDTSGERTVPIHPPRPASPPPAPPPPALPLFGPTRARRLGRRTVAAAALLALGGCALIDQTTFAPAPRPAAPAPHAAPAIAAAPRIDRRTPLLTIGADTPASAYRSLLGFAVQAATRRDHAVRFDVTAIAPAGLAPAREQDATAAATAEAAQVMRALTAAGVKPGRILLRAVLDSAVRRHEVRVYVR